MCDAVHCLATRAGVYARSVFNAMERSSCAKSCSDPSSVSPPSAVGVYEFYDLAAMETHGGTRKVHTVIKLAYEAGGKYGVLGLFGVAGVAPSASAGFRLARRPRGNAQTA